MSLVSNLIVFLCGGADQYRLCIDLIVGNIDDEWSRTLDNHFFLGRGGLKTKKKDNQKEFQKIMTNNSMLDNKYLSYFLRF